VETAESGIGTPREHELRSAGLRRDLDVLRELASEESLRRGGLGVTRIAERLGREKSQISRALRALAAEGLAERDSETRTYQLGWELYRLAARGVQARLVRAASPVLRRLAEQLQAETRLSVVIDGQVMTLASVVPGRRTRSGLRSDLPSEQAALTLAETPSGPVLALDWSDAALADEFAEDETSAMHEHVRTARREGVVHYPGVDPAEGRYAAPVRDFRGVVVAALQIGTVAQAVPASAADPARTVAAAAAELSAALGYEPPASRYL
jgi:DNA-binding IclR family transcriptional regulator